MIGRKLRAARTLKGLTVAQMAKKLKCTTSAVHQMEKQESVHTRTLERWADILGFTPGQVHGMGDFEDEEK